MQNRIQIDGVWYIREQQEPEVEIDIMRSEVRAIESDKYVFEVSRLEISGEPGIYYDGIDIKFTDKREKPWVIDHWDNVTWMIGVSKNHPPSLAELSHLCPQGVAELQALLKELIKEGWLCEN